jgi:hypothetical protein
VAAFVLTMTIANGVSAGDAQVRVEGNVAAIRLEAREAPVSDTLYALGTPFNVRYRTSLPLDGVINGTYTGSLAQVMSRLLEGYNYVVKTERDTIEVVIVGKKGDRAVPIAQPPAPASRSLASQWRSGTPAQK